VATPLAARSAAFSPWALLRACRPRQWAKNILLAGAPCAAGVIGRPAVVVEVLGGFVAFCLLSSATYLVNDVRDRHQDRCHPRKCRRPVAAGELSVRAALSAAVVVALCGLALAAAVHPALAAVALGYLLLTGSYSMWWRRVAFLDIAAIAAGFVLRAVAGGVAADVALSRWFLVVTSACALFLITGKRHAEVLAGGPDALTRATLRHYSLRGLRLLLGVAACAACVAYAMWAFGRAESGPWYELSAATFVLWLVRYGVRLGRGAGQAPEELILSDLPLLALGGVWVLLFVSAVYVGH
jgi:decaprenyl-phosphate phosphoribosyltransferase